jgi:hypothetical protein
MVPVPVSQGTSSGYLKYAEGVDQFAGGPGVARATINWNDICYSVMGSKLVVVNADGTTTVIGDVGSGGTATLDYSFDRLAVVSNKNLFYYDGSELQQVTDPDLGDALDVIWVDGYFMTTDGEFLVVTELNDPFAIDPLKYGSSEADPDPIKALLKLRNEPYALNRYTIEVFDNIGGTGFPFQRIDGAQIQRGVIGTHMCAVFLEAVAFVGGGRHESISVWLGANGSSTRLATREIDLILAEYTEEQLETSFVEARVDKGHQLLLIHLPDRTLVYDAAASATIGQPVWFELGSSLERGSTYRARHLVWCYDQWLVGDTQKPNIGSMNRASGEHWGETVGWEFGTLIIYNEGNGAIFHELELVALSGRSELGKTSTVWTQYSLDGEAWSMPKGISAGRRGRRDKRLVWLSQGPMRHWRIQRFQGTSDARLAVSRLEARLEPLVV